MSDHELDALAAGPLDSDDLLLLALMREHADRTDPVPSGLTDRIELAMTVAGLEAEVARLISMEDVAVRSLDYERATSITFASDQLSVMVTIEQVADGVVVRGWLTTPGAEVELRGRDRTHLARTDADGRFQFADVERGLAHLVIRPTEPDSSPVITPAFEL